VCFVAMSPIMHTTETTSTRIVSLSTRGDVATDSRRGR
jgi:hypothetical protein